MGLLVACGGGCRNGDEIGGTMGTEDQEEKEEAVELDM